MKLSLVIPARNVDDPKLKELLRSIQMQDFPKEELEVLVITEGTSESAKAIGIRRAKGEVIGILASDNELIYKDHLSYAYSWAKKGFFNSALYYHSFLDNALNRYFALIGGNDPLSYYMGKNDKRSYANYKSNLKGAIGDNGFFIRKDLIEKTDLDNYYHIDNAIEATEGVFGVTTDYAIWHKTGGNIFSFFAKRYRYGLQHAFNKNRRWHLVDFSNLRDIWHLTLFVIYTLTIIQPLMLSVRGYLKVRDKAWFLHPLICGLTLLVYTALIIRVGLRQMFQLLFVPMDAQRA